MTNDELIDLLSETVIAAYGRAHGDGQKSLCLLLGPAFNAVIQDNHRNEPSPARQLMAMREKVETIGRLSSTALVIELL